jgi:phosphatidylserine/phosphatidylglycerophosphate/cardiolipin synthase-like enzyme
MFLSINSHCTAFDTGCSGDGSNGTVVTDYLFNEGSGATAYNSGTTGAAGDATLTNGPAFSNDVPSVNVSCGSSVSLPSSGAGTAALEAAVGYDPLAGATQFTIMAWVKRESPSASSNTSARIVSDIDSLGATANGVEFRFVGSAGTLSANLNGTLRGTTVGGIVSTNNSWVHVAVVYDGSRPATNFNTRHFHFYVNAIQQGSGVSNSTLNVTVGGNSNPLTVGNSAVSRSAANQFVGKIDDLRILRGFAPDAAGSGNTNSIILCYMNSKDDYVAPTISCPSDKTVNTDPGHCSATNVSLGTPVASDNCGTVTVTSNAPASYSVGTTMVIWTATDAVGDSSSCTQLVTVVDNEAPTISCASDVMVNADPGQCSSTNVVLGAPSTGDNCAVTSVDNNSPGTFPVGTTTVTWTARDAASNSSTCQQHVTVIDNQAPSITCPSPVTAYTDAGVCTASGVALGTPTTGDNCSVATVTNNAAAAIPLGTNIVTWTVTDSSGNSNTCQQTVVILDNKLPSITCPSDVTVNADAGTNIASNVALGTPTTSDNCSVANVTSNAPATFPIGTTMVTWTVVDGSGNSNTCSQLVTVLNGGNNRDVVITELATGYANNYQWFEVYNRGTGTVDIAGWKIQVGGSNYSITNYTSGSVLSGSTYAVVARVATNFLNSYPDFKGQVFTAAYPTLSNTGRQVTLKDAALNTVESFTYITNLTGTLERRNYDWANYSSANWSNSAAANGTPNVQNTRKFVRVYFNFPPPQNGSSETNIDVAFVNLVNTATGTAWCAFYQLNRQNVVSALCAAKTNRSVDVRFTTDTDYFSDAGYTNFYAQLQNCGITVKGDSRTSLHHDKFAVIDGRYVWSGSWNSTDSGTTDDVQNGLVIESPSLAQAYEREFTQFWSNKFGAAKTKGGTNDHTVAGASLKVFFSPKDGCASNVANVAKSATANNFFEIYTFTTNNIGDAIITNKNNGLTVRGYMDNLSAGASASQYKALTNAFVDVKRDNYSGLLHHKIMVVDAGCTNNNAQVATGSFNWTTAANNDNDENLLIIYSYDLANIYYQEFLTNYGH